MLKQKICKTLKGFNFTIRYNSDAETSAVAFLVRTGSTFDENKTLGTAHMLEHLLFSQTASFNRLNGKLPFQELAKYGCVNAYTDREHTVYYADSLTQFFDKTLKCLMEVVMDSRFDKEDVEKERAIILNELRASKDRISWSLRDFVLQKSFPRRNFAKPILGTETTLKTITHKCLAKFYSTFYHRKNMHIVVDTNLSLEAIEKLLVETMEKVERSSMTGKLLEAEPELWKTFKKRGLKFSPFRGYKLAKTSQLYFDYCLPLGVFTKNEDVAKAIVAAEVLKEHLFVHARENLALCYEITSYVERHRFANILFVSGNTKSENLEALHREVLEGISGKRFRAKDLEGAINRIKYSIAKDNACSLNYVTRQAHNIHNSSNQRSPSFDKLIDTVTIHDVVAFFEKHGKDFSLGLSGNKKTKKLVDVCSL